MIETCYMCDQPSSSAEHVPPRFIFPERKDTTGGEDYRRNLITVPSCDIHNSAKQKDDEYLAYVLAACQGINEVGETHFSRKIMRAIGSRPALINMLLQQSSPAFVLDPADSQWHETRRVEVDEKRFYGTLEKIARALHYHYSRGSKWLGSVSVIPHFMSSTAPTAREINKTYAAIKDASNRLFASAERFGENHDVFHYSVRFEPERGVRIIRMAFYGGAVVTALLDETANNSLKSGAAKPRTLG